MNNFQELSSIEMLSVNGGAANLGTALSGLITDETTAVNDLLTNLGLGSLGSLGSLGNLGGLLGGSGLGSLLGGAGLGGL